MLGYLNLKFHSGKLVKVNGSRDPSYHDPGGDWNPERGELDRVQLKTDPVESLESELETHHASVSMSIFWGVERTRVYCMPKNHGTLHLSNTAG